MRPFLSKSFHGLMLLVAILDFLCLEAALVIGYWVWIAFPWHGNFQEFSVFSIILWVLPPMGIVVFAFIDLYKPEKGIIGVREQSLILKGIWIIYFIGFAVSFFYREVHFSRLAVFYSIFAAILLISLQRYFSRRFFDWLSQRDIAVQQALIYGAGYHGQRLERWIRQSPQLGIRVKGYLDDHVEWLVKVPVVPPVIGKLEDLTRLAGEMKIAFLFIAYRNLHEKKVMEIFRLCKTLKIRCLAIPSLYQFHVERIELQDIGGIPLVGFREGFARRSYVLVKRIFDLLISLILLLLLLPLGFVVALSLRVTSKEPVFFSQIRVGKDEKQFRMYKFRTLKTSDLRDQISPELQKEGRRVGVFRNFLRVSGLDEIPQLINVLKGDMSLVGPRPEMPFLVKKYGSLERDRLTVKPGITGLWQISEDRKRLLIHENMDYDLYYIEHMSFNLDLTILLKTISAVAKRVLFGGFASESERKAGVSPEFYAEEQEKH